MGARWLAHSSLPTSRPCSSLRSSCTHLTEASHSQFSDAGCLGNAAADLLCGRGKDSRAQVAGLTTTQMLPWLWQQMVGAQQVRGAAACARWRAARLRETAPALGRTRPPTQHARRAHTPTALQEVPASESPLPGFYAWAEQQQAQGLLEFEVKDVAASEWEGQAAPEAPPAPAYPTAAEEEALCAGLA